MELLDNLDFNKLIDFIKTNVVTDSRKKYRIIIEDKHYYDRHIFCLLIHMRIWNCHGCDDETIINKIFDILHSLNAIVEITHNGDKLYTVRI